MTLAPPLFLLSLAADIVCPAQQKAFSTLVYCPQHTHTHTHWGVCFVFPHTLGRMEGRGGTGLWGRRLSDVCNLTSKSYMNAQGEA